MIYVNMPGTGLVVSRACLGTMTFGGQVSEQDALRIVQSAQNMGINYIDTADVYTKGESERITGKAIHAQRDKWVLESKVCNATSADPNDNGLSRRHIIKAVEDSLVRLNTDYIDVYYLHRPDHRTPLEETMEAMNSLIRSGKIRYTGISNFSAWTIADILALCAQRLLTAPVINQTVYNLLARGIESELIPFAQAHEMGVMVYNPLASGMLTGKFKKGDAPLPGTRLATSKLYSDRYWCDENLDATEAYAQIAREAGISLIEMAMRFCANRPGINCVLVGVSKIEQLEQNVQAVLKDALPQDVLEKIDCVYGKLPVGSRFQYFR